MTNKIYKVEKEINYNQSMQLEDNEAYSEEETDRKKPKVKPLNLTEKELTERLISLKNYNVWKKTKAKRINCRQLVGNQRFPIIDTVASYGCRYGKNQVFIEFIKNQQGKLNQDFQQRPKISIRNHQNDKSSSKESPSFISYKADEKEKDKIYRMINSLSKKAAQQNQNIRLRKRRSTTEPRLASQGQISRRCSPYPKELAKLKHKLKIIPSINERNRTEPTERNHDYQNPTISLGSNSYKNSQPIIQDILPKTIKIANANPQKFDYQKNKRGNYLKNIHSILNRSSQLLNGGSSAGEHDLIRMSTNSYNSAIFHRENKSQTDSLKPQKRQRYLSYWPKYQRYAISDKDDRKFNEILRKCSSINNQELGANDDVNQMMGIIKQQILCQQKQINNELLREQKNSFEHKFNYKINMQRENYKRNIKELLRCKKDYRIEKQREEIRANGIKRMKRIGEEAMIRKNRSKAVEKEED